MNAFLKIVQPALVLYHTTNNKLHQILLPMLRCQISLFFKKKEKFFVCFSGNAPVPGPPWLSDSYTFIEAAKGAALRSALHRARSHSTPAAVIFMLSRSAI